MAGDPARHADTPAEDGVRDEERANALRAAGSVGEALTLATAWLRIADVSPTPALDAQTLLASITGASRATLQAYPERALTPEQAERFALLVRRRARYEPIAYLTGSREFMGIEFRVDRRALIPRPETEFIVEAALRNIRERLERPGATAPVVADIGAGSGAIVVSLAVLEPRLPRLYAVDISPDALALTMENAEAHGVATRITPLLGDLLEPLPEVVDVIIANLPYIAPNDQEVAPSVSQYEPALALYSPDEGLAHIRRLLTQAPARLRSGGSLFLEFGYDQRAGVETLANASFPGAQVRAGADYAGWDRYIEIHTLA